MTMKRLLAIMLAVFLVLAVSATVLAAEQAEAEDASLPQQEETAAPVLEEARLLEDTALIGSGTADDPYLLFTQEDLLQIDSHLSSVFSLANDITVTLSNWTPIGVSSAFTGHFNGNGNTISGLVITGDYSRAGFFAQNSGLIENLKVDVTFSPTGDVGGLAGYNNGTIRNCFSSGKVTNVANNNVGGLVGYNQNNGIITTSGSTAAVTGGSGNTGGLVGFNYGDSSGTNAQVINSYARGAVSGTGRTGGLIGRSDIYSSGRTATVRNCYASGRVNGYEGAGLIGSNGGYVFNSYYRSANTGNTIGFSLSDDNMKIQSSFYCWDFNNIWVMDGDYPAILVRGEERSIELSGGDGYADDPYLIETEEQLYALAMGFTRNNSQTYYQLARDIALTAKYWTPIGEVTAFAGTFDGAGHTISGLNHAGTDYGNVGLFGQNSGTILNLTVTGSVSGSGNVGLLAGYNSGTVTNCFSSGSVANTSNGKTGGLVGANYNNGLLSACGSTASVTGGSGNAGGLVGFNYGDNSGTNARVLNCYARGAVSGSGNTGGLIGRSDIYSSGRSATVRNCYASGRVNGFEGAGLIGSNGGSVSNSYYLASNQGNNTGFSLTATNMKQQASYYCWDFDNIWVMEENGYPSIDYRGSEKTISITRGEGYADDPFLIETEEQLYGLAMGFLRNNSQTYYQLAGDITLTARYWTPIGETSVFAGIFDGNGHTISGLNHTGTNYGNVGLFGRNSGTIQNLTVSGTVSGSGNVGLLAGFNTGTISNCLSSGSAANTSNGPTGGLVGYNQNNGLITASGSTATVRGGSGNTGGLVGINYADNSGTDARVINSYAQGMVSGTGNTGGLVGRSDVYSSGRTATVRNCYASGRVNDGEGAGLIASNGGYVFNSYYLSANTGSLNGFSLTSTELKQQSCFYCWDFDNIWEINGGYPYINLRGDEKIIEFTQGEGYSEDPYMIETEEQLYAIAMGFTRTNSQIYYQLANDIAVTAKYWTPIGLYTAFAGVFDGAGHTISGISISGTDFGNVGLFGNNSGTIQNLTINAAVSGSGNVGLLMGHNTGTVSNCFSIGSAANTSNGATGGLVGYNLNNGAITSSGSSASVSGGSGNTGGLVGTNYSDNSGTNARVINCYAQGSVSGRGNTGGLIGRNTIYSSGRTATVQNCYSIGLVTTSGTKGGLIGSNGGTVTSSFYNSGTSTATDTDRGTPATTEEMKEQATYLGWDFTEVWGIASDVNDGYPYLRGIVPASSVAVTGVSLNKTSLTLSVGESGTLTATVQPEEAGNKAVIWSSSDTSVAAVSDGSVLARAAGSATITATTVDGGFEARCQVLVLTPGSSGASLSAENFDNLSGAELNYTSPASGDFVVTNSAPCAVFYSNGTAYARLSPTRLSDGSYSYSLPEDYDSSLRITILLAGDLTGDREVNSTDALQLMRWIAGLRDLSEANQLAANVNGDSVTDVNDALQILRISAGIVTPSW